MSEPKFSSIVLQEVTKTAPCHVGLEKDEPTDLYQGISPCLCFDDLPKVVTHMGKGWLGGHLSPELHPGAKIPEPREYHPGTGISIHP